MDQEASKRLHIGQISQKLADELDDFQSRLANYGEVVSPLELHKKPLLDTYFGFITLKQTQKQFASLKSAYHGNKYKGSILTINPAGQNYSERLDLEKQKPDPPLNRDQLKRKYSDPPLEYNLLPGRLRTSKRKGIKSATYRILKNDGKIVTIHCKKQKLWGYDKEKQTENLVSSYSNGQWKDGTGSTIQTIDFAAALGDSYVKGMADSAYKTNEVGEDDDEEKSRNLNILDSLFSSSKDDTLKVDMNEFMEEENIQMADRKPAREDHDSMQIDGSEETNHVGSELNDQNEELGESETTSALRALFNEEGSQGALFSGLVEDNDDIDYDKNDNEIFSAIVEKESPSPNSPVPKLINRTNNNKGLFFLHHDSPFLAAQSQLSRITKATFSTQHWETEFWAKRGEWNREFRRRRRDVLRQLKKKALAKGKAVI